MLIIYKKDKNNLLLSTIMKTDIYQKIELALTDYRDVLWQAEYDCTEKRLRDFNHTLHEPGLINKKKT